MTEQAGSPSFSPAEVRDRLEQALFEIRRVIAGQDAMLERVLVCLLAQGHLLIEGVPGLAKTLTIKTAAGVLGGSFSRIQFTPDLVPADLVGTRIYRPDQGSFDTELGPVFCNFLLADEINRAPAKVQSALLEVMQERHVTIAHTTYPVPEPFLVHGDPEPDRVGGDVPAAGGAGRPLHAQDPDRLPRARRGADDRAAAARRGARAARGADARPAAELQAVVGVYVDPALVSYAVALATATRTRRPRASPTSPATSSTAPARAGRSASRRRRARSRSCAAATTRPPRTCGRSRRTRSATGSCSATRRSPRSVTPDAILDRVLAAVPMPEVSPVRPRRGMSEAVAARPGDPGGPGPGALPTALLRALADRRLAADRGDARGRVPLEPARRRRRAGAGAAVRPRRRRAADRVERDRAHRHAARPRPPRRARARDVARARRLALDAVRHRRPAQGGRRGRRRARDRPRLDAARQPARASSPSAAPSRDAAARAGPARARRAARDARAREPEPARVGATSLGAALARTAATARQRGLVVVVSDFRGPLDWRPPLLELLPRHDVIAVEVRDPREQELPDVGEVWLVDPETGRQVRVDTRSAALRARFAAAAAEERSGVARVLDRARRPARRPLDRGRLAAHARRLPAERRGELRAAVGAGAARARAAAASCSGCAPTGGGARRRRASANLALLPNLVERAPGKLRLVPAALLLLGLSALVRRDGEAAREAHRGAPRRDGRARDRRLALDGRAGRDADAPLRRGLGARAASSTRSRAASASRSSPSAAARTSPCRRPATAT